VSGSPELGGTTRHRHTDRCDSLPIFVVGHHGRQVGAANQREQTLFVVAEPSKARLQVVKDVHVGDDSMMRHALETFIVKVTGFAAPDHRGADLDVGKTMQPDQCANDGWNVANLVLGQVPGLRPRIGDQLFAVAIVEFLRDGQRLVGVPPPALTASLLQGGQVE